MSEPDIADLIDAAILDALVNMGGATAWTGDGSSCAVQIVQNIIEERDEWKAKYETLCKNMGISQDGRVFPNGAT